MEFGTLWKVTIGYAVAAVVVGLTLFLNSYVPLIPGLIILWAEISLGFAFSSVARRLTRRAVAMQGIGIEQNPIMRQMLATGDFRLLRAVFTGMALFGLTMTVVFIRIGTVRLSVLVLLFAFPLAFVIDALNDIYWIRRLESEATSGAPVPTTPN
ncbi:MAG: hypothetical protein ABSB29_08275 [Nitrososphaerales archaeon]|jgi:hypothetical protein